MMLSIVIPAHNEREAIRPTVVKLDDTLRAAGIPFEIVVVNDHSTDGTPEELARLARELPAVRWVSNERPGGFGYAIRAGLDAFQGDAVCIVMADASDDPRDVVTYYHKLGEGYDCVFGSRFTRKSRVVDYPGLKLAINRLANLFIRVLFRIRLNDTTNAFKCYRREVIEGVQPILSPHFNITVELPLKAIIRGYTYAIVPINWYNRTTGVSKLKIQEMGSRYLFIVLYAWLEKRLSRGDYRRRIDPPVPPVGGPPSDEPTVVAPQHAPASVTPAPGGTGSALSSATQSEPLQSPSSAEASATAPPAPGPPRSGESSSRLLLWALRLALLPITLALYWSSLGTNFVGDDWYFLARAHDHPFLWNLTPVGGYHYNPVLGFIIFVTYHLFGLNPMPYHLVAYAFFWLGAVLAMQLGWKLSGRLGVGALAGLLFVTFGSQYEAAIWGVVAYGPGVSTVLYIAGLLLFMGAHDARRSRGHRRIAYIGFLLALIVGPFIYEQDITLIGACVLYRALVIESGASFAPAALVRRARAWLADFALPGAFFIAYLGLKVWLAGQTPVPQLPGLAGGWNALPLMTTVALMRAVVPGASDIGVSAASLIWITPLGYLLDLFIELLLFVLLFIKVTPVARFLLALTAMLVVTQVVALGNIASRHLFLISVPTTILWAMLLVALPDWLRARLARRAGQGTVPGARARWLAYAPSLGLALLFVLAGVRYGVSEQGYWQGAVRHVDDLMAEVRAYSAADPGATALYLIDVPDYVAAPTGETMYEFRNSPHPLVELTMPDRFALVETVRTDDSYPNNWAYTVRATPDQIARWSQDERALVLKYEPATGRFMQLTA